MRTGWPLRLATMSSSKSLGLLDAAERAQHHFRLPVIDAAAGLLLVLADQRLADVLDGQVLVLQQLVGVDDDVDGPLPAADEDDRPDAGQRLEVFLDPLAGDLGDLAEVAAAGDGDRHDRGGVEVELVDDRRVGARRAAG